MEQSYILALDQGTTSSRAILFDHNRKMAGMAQKEYTQRFPRDGWVEHDPWEIWFSQLEVAKAVLREKGIQPGQIAAIGITNQRETTIVWDRETGEPIYNAIVWQCRRTHAICEKLKREGYGPMIAQKTGLLPDAYFSGTKIKWILDEVEGAREKAKQGRLLFGTVDSWLIWQLTEGKVHCTDYTNASRTMLFNINTLCWDEDILALLDIPASMLPQAKPSSGFFGETTLFGGNIPILGVAGDQQSALFGQMCVEKGDVKNTYGTGCFMLMNTGETPCFSQNGMVTTLAAFAGEKPQYAIEGSVFTGGSVVQWLRDEMKLIESSAASEEAAMKVPDNGGVYLVPAFTGLGAPYWDMMARGMLIGVTRGTSREHVVRAALEAIAYQSKELLDAIYADTGIPITELKVDGGASANGFLMQFQADIMGCPIIRPENVETTALGAAYLAGIAAGQWSLEELKDKKDSYTRYIPSMEESGRQLLLKNWKKAVSRALSWAE